MFNWRSQLENPVGIPNWKSQLEFPPGKQIVHLLLEISVKISSWKIQLAFQLGFPDGDFKLDNPFGLQLDYPPVKLSRNFYLKSPVGHPSGISN